MRRTFIYIIFFMFISDNVLSQSQIQTKVDSIVTLAVSNSEEALFSARFEEARKAINISYFENLPGYGSKHRILLTMQDIRVNGFVNIVFARKTNHLENFEKLKVLLPFAIEMKDQEALGHYYRMLSDTYNSTGKPDSSAFYEEKAVSIFNETHNFEEIAKIRASNISRIHNQLLQANKKQEIIELIPTYEREIEYSKIYSKYALAYNTRHLAQIHRRQTLNFNEALRLFKLSLDLRIEIGFKPFIPASYSSLGDVYMELGEYASAIEMYSKSSEIAEEIGFVRYQWYPNIQIGDFYQENGQSERATEYYLKALKFSSDNNYSTGINQTMERIRKMNITKNKQH